METRGSVLLPSRKVGSQALGIALAGHGIGIALEGHAASAQRRCEPRSAVCLCMACVSMKHVSNFSLSMQSFLRFPHIFHVCVFLVLLYRYVFFFIVWLINNQLIC